MSTNRTLSYEQAAEVRAPDNLFMNFWRDVNSVLASLGSPEATFGDIYRAHEKHGMRNSHEAAHYVRGMRGEE